MLKPRTPSRPSRSAWVEDAATLSEEERHPRLLASASSMAWSHGKLETTSSMPVEATVLGSGGELTTAGPLGTMSGGPVTTGPPLGFGIATVAKQSTLRKGRNLSAR